MFGKITKVHGSGLIEAQIVSSEKPATMPTTSNGIDNLGDGYTLAPGSTMIVTSTDNEYMLGDDGTWEELPAGGDVSGKADKVSNAVSGNFAGLDSSGNLTDSGKKPADFATPSDVAAEEIASTSTSTSLTLTDSADGYLQGITVKGKSRTTKNLLEITETTQTVNDVTFTVDKTLGKIVISGTASADTSFIIGFCKTGINAQVFGINSNDPTKYWIAISIENAFSGRMYQYTNSQAYDFSSETRQCAFFIGIASGVTVNDIIYPFEMTVEDYAADPTFEPYFSGIKSIGDDGFEVETCGKNLVNAQYNWGITAAGVIISENSYICSVAKIKKGKTYIWASKKYPTRNRIYCCAFYETYPTIESVSINGKRLVNEVSNPFISQYDGYIVIREDASENDSEYQLELGSTATAYEPYTNSTATLTTALPLRSVSDEIYDTLDNTKVTKMCAEVDLGDLEWEKYGNNYDNLFYTMDLANIIERTNDTDSANLLCPLFVSIGVTPPSWSSQQMGVNSTGRLYINYPSYTSASDFKTAVTGVKLVYPLATPTETPLTSSEKSALASLRTYDSTTHIDATDEPSMTVDYLRNTENGKATANVDKRAVNQVLSLLSLIAAPYDDTATYAQGAYCTYLGTLYKSNTAIGTAEPFNSAHWTATTVMAEV